jgi:N12 class adenine-specific DNA methylase
MAFNTGRTLADNIAAIRIALDFNGKQLSTEEVESLSKYAGFGSIKAILYPPGDISGWQAAGASEADLKLHPQVMELHHLLAEKLGEDYKAAFDSLKNSMLTAFYTPGFVPEMLYWALKENNIIPRRLYEPSAGAGVFLSEAVKSFPGLQMLAVEKDLITGKILQAFAAGSGLGAEVLIKGFEETSAAEKGQADLIVSNIPYGNFAVHDPAFGKGITTRIHNYFFAKGLDKLADGGLLAYLVTDGFLNSPSNSTARKYLFTAADLMSVSVLPANLMKDNAGVEVGTHFIIVQKNDNKEMLSEAEVLLLDTIEQENSFGAYHINAYLAAHPELVLGDELFEGTNAYGNAARTIWQTGELLQLAGPLMAQIDNGLAAFDVKKWQAIKFNEKKPAGRQLTFLHVPEAPAGETVGQLGLFDAVSVNDRAPNKAQGYLSELDRATIDASTARQISTIRTTTRPEHDSIVLLTARSKANGRYLYKLFANVGEISVPNKWLTGLSLGTELDILSVKLKYFAHDYRYEGDTSLENAFKLQADRPKAYTDLRPFYEKGTLVIMDSQTGLLGEFTGKEAEFAPLPVQRDLDLFKSYIVLRDAYLQLSILEAQYLVPFPELRDALNHYYDAFVTQFGELNKSANRSLILLDAAFGFKILASVEVRSDEAFVKSDIFTWPVFPRQQQLKTNDPVEALARCLNDFGRVDLSVISESTGLKEADIIYRLDKQILLNPGLGLWETTDNYLSGNVVEKLKVAEISARDDPENFQVLRSLAAIRRVQPEKIPFELLDFNLGERWVPAEFYERFATELFNTPTSVNYFASVDTFKVHYDKGNPVTDEEFLVVPRASTKIYGGSLLEYALENTSPHITYPEQRGDKMVRVPDTEAIQSAHRKVEAIRARYLEWLKALSGADKTLLETLYNETFNCYVLREYDGSHLQFPGLDRKALGITDLYPSQKDAAWRVIQNRGSLIDHEVGLGKTLTMIIAAMEMKRLGIVLKPMIVAMKANVAQIRDTFKQAYPHAKILAPGENDFTPAKRMRLFHEIKNNNWDCIILTHDQFGMIPQSPEIQKQIFRTELDNIELDLDTLKLIGGAVSKSMLKGLEIRKNNLDGKLKDILHAIDTRKDIGVNFQEMNVDHLFVDESHKFKNLTFTTRHNRVAGLGNMAGSQKALNMLFAVRSLQERFNADLCVTFLSGTPISNSLTEMYLIFKYLRPIEMERQQISNFDAWAAVYARKTVDFEFSVTNEIRAKERYRYFIKVPELARFYNAITDYKTAKHINLDKPEIDEQLVNLAPSAVQQDFTRRLMKFAQTGDATLLGRRPLTNEEDMGRMLIATNYAKKMAVDMRLINPLKYADHPNNKVSVCARNVAKLYSESDSNKGTQIVFSDIGTPRDGFNIYDAIKNKLVNDFAIPAAEITFIHNWTDRQKPELFKRMNAGQIRILIGSTEKAGTGLNVQQRVVAMHHLDIPWKPSELEQRDGRGARQGNWLAKQFFGNKVRNFIYATEMSLDNYKFGLLKNKQRFISQMKNNELSLRVIDEGAMDEQSGMNFSEYIAILSGDTTLLEKTKLERKLAEMESNKTMHYKDVARSRYLLVDLEKKLVSTKATLEKLITDEAAYKGVLKYDKEGAKLNPLSLLEESIADPVVLGKRLIDIYKNFTPESAEFSESKIGKLYGYDLYVNRQIGWIDTDQGSKYDFETTMYAQSPQTGIKYMQNNGTLNIDNPKIAARYFLSAIDRVSHLVEKYRKQANELSEEIPVVRGLTERVFDKETELAAMKVKLAELGAAIEKNIREKESQQASADIFPDDDAEDEDISFNSGLKR